MFFYRRRDATLRRSPCSKSALGLRYAVNSCKDTLAPILNIVISERKNKYMHSKRGN